MTVLTGIRFGALKVICDVAICTIAAALLVGNEVKLFAKWWGSARDRFLGAD